VLSYLSGVNEFGLQNCPRYSEACVRGGLMRSFDYCSGQSFGLNLRSVREFAVTLTEESAIAAAASIGFNNTPVTA